MLLALPAQAQQAAPAGKRQLTVDDVLHWRIASSPVVSPDGRRAVFLISENDLQQSRAVTHLWSVDTNTKYTRRLTHSDGQISSPRWSPDGRWIAFLAARGGDGAAPKPQVWLLASDGGEAFPLTQAAEGVRTYAWAPDSQSVFYVAAAPQEAAERARRDRLQERKADHYVVDEERPRREIWQANIEKHAAERVFAGDPGVDEVAVAPDGRRLVFRSNGTGDPDDDAKYNLFVLDLAARRAQPLTIRPGQERAAVWSPDSTRVAFLAPRDPQISFSQEEVFLVTVPAGTAGEPAEPQQLTRDFAGAIERLQWPKGEGIYFAAAVRTENRVFRLDATASSVAPASPAKWFLEDADWSADGSTCVALSEGPRALPEVVVLRPASELVEPQALTDLNPQLRQFALGEQEVIRWKGADGMEIEGILTKPPGWQPAGKYPLLLDVHGGPHNRRPNTMTAGHFQHLFAARGWLVLQPNFRGSSAYGHDFGIANRGDFGGKDAEDILAGVDFAVAQGWADPERLAVMGESYGGYMTNWLIARTKRFRAAASLFGIFNFITDFSNSEISSWEKDYLGKYYWDDLPLYLDRSPAKYAADIHTPVLIQHGDADTNTFISNSQEMYRALRTLGRTVKFVRYPREGHGFLEPQHVRAQYQQILAWLDEHALGLAAKDVSEPVRSGLWELRVSNVRSPESYGGLAARGRFVEVELILRAAGPVTERFSLLLFNTSGSEIWLEPSNSSAVGVTGGALYPEGLVSETLGQRLLAKSQAQVVAIQPDRDGNYGALAVTVAFDVPASAHELLLRVKDFPPVRIEVPVPQP